MKNNTNKLQIYKHMIQYLMDTTNYSLIDIASLTNANIKTIEEIWNYHTPQLHYNSEHKLVNLFRTIFEINLNIEKDQRDCK